MQILSIVDFFVCIVNTCTRYYSMHDAVDNYLELLLSAKHFELNKN